MILYTKYQSSRPCGFRQENFFMLLPLKAYVKHVTPGARAIFGNRAIILTNLVEVHKVMLHTKYQNSKPYGFRQDFLYFSLYKPM